MISATLARRSLRDTDNIARVAVRAAARVSGKIRARYLERLRGTKQDKFRVFDYAKQQLLPVLVYSQVASHLAGYRRLFLMQKQTPSLMRKALEEQEQLSELKLSELSDALSILTKKTFLNVDELQAKYETRALKILNDTSAQIEESLEETFKGLIDDGSTVAEAVRRLGTKFDELGLSPAAPYKLEAIFRSQLQMSFAAGRWQAEQHPDIQEILWGYKYVTTGDDRVREEHAAIEGTTLPKDDPFWNLWYPPNGWNCRCQVIPIFEERDIVRAPEFDEEGERLLPDKDFRFNPGEVFR